MKSRLKILGLFVVMVAFLLVALNLLTTSTIQISIEPEVSPLTTTVTVNGSIVPPSGSGGNVYTTKVRPGKHIIKVVSAGFSDTVSEVSTSIREDKSLTIKLNKVIAEDVARSLVSEVDDVKVYNPKFFGNNNWMIFFTSSSSDNYDGSVVVAKFNDISNEWEIVDEGTDINIYDQKYSNAPSDLIAYMEGLYR